MTESLHISLVFTTPGGEAKQEQDISHKGSHHGVRAPFLPLFLLLSELLLDSLFISSIAVAKQEITLISPWSHTPSHQTQVSQSVE